MQTALVYLKGVGPERARLLKEEVQLKTYQDLLHFFPTATLTEAASTPFNSCQKQRRNSNQGAHYLHCLCSTKRGKRMVATFKDDTGEMELVWFRGHQWIRISSNSRKPTSSLVG